MMQNKLSRSYLTSTSQFCAPNHPQNNRRNSSTMCVFDQSPNNMNSTLWLGQTGEPTESILYGFLDASMQQKKTPPPPPSRESRIDSLKAACAPLFNSVRDFFRRNLSPLTYSTTPEDCTTDFSNSSVYMGLVTTIPMANNKEKPRGNVPTRSDLIDLRNFTLIHSMDCTDDQQKMKFSPPREETPPVRKITKSDLNVCPEPSPPKPSSSPDHKKSQDQKPPSKRQKSKKSQNTQHVKGKKGKHKQEKMRKNVFWDIRDDLNSEEDFEDEFEDVLCTEISSSIDENSASLSPHKSDYVSDFIASIPSSQPSRSSPMCTSFVKKLPSVLRMDIPFSPKKKSCSFTCKRSPDYDSDDSFIVFACDSPKNTPESVSSTTSSTCDRLLQLNTCPTTNLSRCDRRRSVSEDSEDSFVIFTDGNSENECLEDSSDSEESCSSDSDDDDTESYPKQLDSGFEERKVRFNLKPEVHVICAWNFAYRQARKGTWDQVARDRDRFEKRILSLEHVLKPILQRDHREKIYKERFLAENNSD